MSDKLPRYEAQSKRIIKIGRSLAISIDAYQINTPVANRFKIGDMVYIRIAKADKTFSGTARVNTYGSAYIVYLNSRWGFEASDIVNVVVEKVPE